ncbi:MAG: DUF4270 family protein [Mucinivorans sp.]
MKKYFLASLLATMFFIGCTAVDGTFGSDMVPPSQQMKTKIDSNMKVTTYQISMDSMVSTTGRLVGSMIDPLVGRTTVGTLTNFTPYGFPESKGDTLFGKNPIVDSMILMLGYSAAFGDTTARMDVTIYELKNYVLKDWQLHYMNFDPSPYYDKTKPLAKYRTNGKWYDTVHLPLSFAQKFVEGPCNIVKDNPYRNDTLFHTLFNGLYIKAKPITRGEGLIYECNLQQSTIAMFYHNDNKKKDSTRFWFDASTNEIPAYIQRDVSFTVAKHDYSFAKPSEGGVDVRAIGNLETPVKTAYIQGLGGLGARVVVDMNYIAKMKKDAVALGYKTIGLHRAELRWHIQKRTLYYYDDSFTRMVLYSWKGKLSKAIPDYSPMLEDASQTISPISGILLRSVGYYSQNITSFMQRLFTGAETNPELNLLPPTSQDLLPLRTVVGGSASVDRAPEIILTYTLIK